MQPLKESYNGQKQFISDAGHELKTPVAAIKANLSVLQRETGENQWISNIIYETQCMEDIVIQLLELARAENGSDLKETVNVSEIVMGEILVFELPAFEKGLSFSFEEVEADIFITGESQQIRRLVSVLLNNAVEHSFPGGNITVVLRQRHGKIFFSVENRGEEIPEDRKEKIFERFCRGDEQRTGGQKHYGLGLAIAKAITDNYKGSISVKCENGNVKFLVIL